METLGNLLSGFSVAISPANLLFVVIGVSLGMIIGSFPGLSAATAIALLLPVTFSLDPVSAIIMLAGIYYGSQYGNSVTAVLVNTPGDSAAVVTAVEGHEMAKRGRAGKALMTAALGSFVAGTIAVILFSYLAPQLAAVALSFGPPEYFAIVVFALATLPAFAGRSKAKMMISASLGILVALVGMDDLTGKARLTFDQPELLNGVQLVPALIGLFGIGEAIYASGHLTTNKPSSGRFSLRDLAPSAAEWLRVRWPIARGTFLGFVVGILPGAGATIASFLSYAAERARSKHRHEFGKGAIEGVAGPESSNNAAAVAAMIPLLTLGIPGSASTAVLAGGFVLWGLNPGPLLFQQEPDFVWGLIASMYVGNVLLVIMATLLVPLFARILRVKYTILLPIIVVFCAVGAFSTNGSLLDVWIMLGFGVVGYIMRRADVPIAPLVLGMVLGPMLDTSLREALTISQGDIAIFTTSPIAVGFFVATALVVILPPLANAIRKQHRPAQGEPPGEGDHAEERGGRAPVSPPELVRPSPGSDRNDKESGD